MKLVFVGGHQAIIDSLTPGVCAVSHASAWATISAEHPEILIIDCKEPNVGFHLSEEIRRGQWDADPYILLLLYSRADISKATEAGCDDFLIAPFDTAEFQGKLTC